MTINRLPFNLMQTILQRCVLATAFLSLVPLIGPQVQNAAAQETRPLKNIGGDFGLGDDAGQSGADEIGDVVFPKVNFGGLADAKQKPITWSASYRVTAGTGQLEIKAVVGRSWHVYSTTQPAGGPLKTKISVPSAEPVTVEGNFTPNHPPEKSVSKVYPGVTIEEHGGVVLWTATIKTQPGYKKDIKVDVSALACQAGGACMPSKETLTAKFVGPIKATPAVKSDHQSQLAMPNSGAESPLKSLAPQSLAPQSLIPKSLLPKTSAPKTTVPNTPPAELAANPTTFRDDDYQVVWTAGVSSSIGPGQTGKLIFSATPEAKFHVYHGVVDDSESATNFVITDKSKLLVGRPTTEQPVISKNLFPSIPGVPDMPPVKYHEGQVSWTLPVHVPVKSTPGEYEVSGLICYQACTDSSCLQPKAMKFTATVMVTDQTDNTLQPISIEPSKFSSAIGLAAKTKWVDVIRTKITDPELEKSSSNPKLKLDSAIADQLERERREQAKIAEIAQATTAENQPDAVAPGAEETAAVAGVAADSLPSTTEASGPSLPLLLLMAFGGGIILNLMPCVLPVVGLKVMSFVQQAGEDRRRIFSLNMAYVAGILAVFAVLTGLAVFFSFGWGQQFTYLPVRLGLTILVFALALSYLGVWELPTPGMATGETSQDLQGREGLSGAFFKGAFATVLATPCSGPLLGAVLGYTITLHPMQTAAIMMTVGVGMAIPYVILGLFPSTVSFLPKPGDWMVTLKEFLAFLLLFTVAFFFNQFSEAQKLPVFVTLIGVWFGCWVIGKVPPWENIQKKIRGWGIGVTSAALIGWVAFTYLGQRQLEPGDISGDGIEYIVDNHLRWEKYDEVRLQELQSAGKTVMLDFTASWCFNCIVNKKVALDTAPTSELLADLDGVAMLADWTDQSDEIKTKLATLRSKSIPLLVIYPGNQPDKPIVLRELVSQSAVLKALKQAGPSTTGDQVAALTGTGTSLAKTSGH